jgi:4-hydroxy-2-oxoheptanedioate aldolase
MPGATPRDALRRRILDGETLFGAWLDVASPLSAEISASAGYDWCVIDMEHGSVTEADVLALLLAVEVGGAAPLVGRRRASAFGSDGPWTSARRGSW